MISARKQLGQQLHAVRKQSGMDQAALAARLELSQAQISRLENGTRTAHGDTVTAWLDACGHADGDLRAGLLELVEQAGAEITPWRKLQSDGWDTHQRRYEDREAAAHIIRIYQPSVIPGLLQAPGYAEWLLRDVVQVPAGQMDEAVAARQRRGRLVLGREEQRLDVVIAEHVLRQEFGDRSVRLQQLVHLQNAAFLPNVEVAILPTTTVMPSGWGHSFVLLEMPDDADSSVAIELEDDEVRITDPVRIKHYRERYEFYQRHAIREPGDVVEFLAAIQVGAAAG